MVGEFDVWYDAEECFSDDSFVQGGASAFGNVSQIANEALAEGKEALDLLESLIEMRVRYLEHLSAGGRARSEWMALEIDDPSADPALLKEDEVRSAMRDAKHVFNSLVGAVRDACRGIDDGEEKPQLWKAVDEAYQLVVSVNAKLDKVDDEIEAIETAERRQRQMICDPKRQSKIASLWETINKSLIG